MPRVGPPPQTELGTALRTLRLKHRYTLRSLADEAQVSHTFIADLERGVDRRTRKKINPGPEVLRRIGNVLGDSYDELMAAAGYAEGDSESSSLWDRIEVTQGGMRSTNEMARSMLSDIRTRAEQLNRLLEVEQVDSARSLRPLNEADYLFLPHLGMIPAGYPQQLDDDHDPRIGILMTEANKARIRKLVKRPQALVVKGHSMTPRISDGDVVVFDPDRRARTGDIVVALVDGEPTLKRLVRRENEVILRAENGTEVTDIVIRDEARGVIQGVVVARFPTVAPDFLVNDAYGITIDDEDVS